MIRIPQERGGAGARHGMGVRAIEPLLAARLLFMLLALLAASAALAQPVSPAEALLFETDHLARTAAPALLVYEFRKASNVEPGYSDTVELDLSRKDGHVHARLRFLSGQRKRDLPDIDDAHGNPVLLGFLEHDIAEMKRLTGGSTTYFRKRIRMALANAAQLGKQPIAFGGKTVEAQVVRIQPYLDDPLHARFEAYVRKTYTFVISEAVPGGVYQISTSLGTGQGGRTFKASDARKGAQSGTTGPGTTGPGTAGPGTASPGATVRGTAGASTANSGNVGQGTGSHGKAGPGAASAGAAGLGEASPGTGNPGAAPAGAARAATQAPGATGSVTRIDETLTLSRVAGPKR